MSYCIFRKTFCYFRCHCIGLGSRQTKWLYRLGRYRVNIVSWNQEYGSLPPAPSKSRSIHGFKVALDADDQPSFSYRLPTVDSSSDILLDLEDHISSATSRMRSKNMSSSLHTEGYAVANITALKGRRCLVPVLCPIPSWNFRHEVI